MYCFSYVNGIRTCQDHPYGLEALPLLLLHHLRLCRDAADSREGSIAGEEGSANDVNPATVLLRS